jgi:alpha-tubulin suppressor-like RCC1 family protein
MSNHATYRWRQVVACTGVALSVTAMSAFAQATSGIIKGSVLEGGGHNTVVVVGIASSVDVKAIRTATGEVVQVARVAADGSYLLSLPPDTYKLLAWDSRLDGADASPAFAPIYYPSALVASAASTLTVTAGAEVHADLLVTYPFAAEGIVYQDLNANGARDDGEPGIPGCTVRIVYGWFTSSVVIAQVTSDENGHYRFDKVPQPMKVTATPPVEATFQIPNPPYLNPPTSGDLRVQDIPLLVPGAATSGTVTGKVLDADTGLGIGGVSVSIAVSADVYSLTRMNSRTSVVTDVDGNFRATSGIATGPYYVKTSNNLGYVDRIYPDAICAPCSLQGGSPISVVTGHVTDGIVLRLSKTGGHEISGVVRGVQPDGSAVPLAGLRVDLSNAGGWWFATATTDVAGAYHFRGLPDAEYMVTLTSQQGYGGYTYGYGPLYADSNAVIKQAERILIAGADRRQVDLWPERPSTIDGSVVRSDSGQGLSLDLVLFNERGEMVMMTTSSSSGAFSFNPVGTGTYYVATDNAAGLVNRLHRADVDGGVDCAACDVTRGSPVVVRTAGSAIAGVNFSLSPGSTISGTVRSVGLPVRHAYVYVYDASGRQVSLRSTSTTAGDDGSYTYQAGLRPGVYYVRAEAFKGSTQGRESRVYDGIRCLACDVTTGTPITVTDAMMSVSGVDFSLDSVVPPAPNDTFETATPVPMTPFHDLVNTADASISQFDPYQPCGTYDFRSRSVWYRFDAPRDGTVTFDTVGSNYDTVISVHTGSRSALQLVPGGCNDDRARGDTASQLTLPVTGGTRYYLLVTDWFRMGGTLSFHARFTPTSATQLAVGTAHSCAIATGGWVLCWGRNQKGQLGDGTTSDRAVPGTVGGLSGGVVAVTAGTAHSCAVTSGGAVRCWGYNSAGQLGDGTTADRWAPVTVTGLESGVVAVVAGGFHTCALTDGGAVRCWGYNSSGQLGDGSTTDKWTPVAVSGLASGVRAVAAGAFHTCALLNSGAVKCWGYNSYGQLGDGSAEARSLPVQVVGLANGVTGIAAGYSHTCAAISGGAVKCWGSNSNGQLGDGTTTDRPLPVPVAGLGVATMVTAGNYHSCAVTSGGGLQCWGFNAAGRLGDGTTADRWSPVGVSGLASGIAAVYAGGEHTCALTNGGAAECWGENASGQLGDGTTTVRLTPTATNGLPGTFTDAPLVSGTTQIKAIHVEELRAAIDALRTRQGMGAFTWVDSPLVAKLTVVKVSHLTQLRQALTDVYLALGQVVPTFAPTVPSAGVTVVAAAQIAELRSAVQAIW